MFYFYSFIIYFLPRKLFLWGLNHSQKKFCLWFSGLFSIFLQAEFEEQYDIVQKIGEGWFSRVYLTEHRSTHHELVLKAINSKNMSVEEFLREFHHSLLLGTHRNILTVFPDMVFTIGNAKFISFQPQQRSSF